MAVDNLEIGTVRTGTHYHLVIQDDSNRRICFRAPDGFNQEKNGAAVAIDFFEELQALESETVQALLEKYRVEVQV